MCVIRDFAADRELPWNLSAEQQSEVRAKLSAGQAVLSTTLARRLNVEPGDSLAVGAARPEPRRADRVGAKRLRAGRTVAHARSASSGRLCDLAAADLFVIACNAGQSRPSAKPVSPTSPAARGLVLQSFAELRRDLDRLIGGITGALLALLVLGFVVGGFGVANTLAMSVLEQTRELALLRVIGMSQRQLGRVVLVESLLLGGRVRCLACWQA